MSYLSEPLQGQGLSVSFRSMMCPALQLLIGTESFGLAGLQVRFPWRSVCERHPRLRGAHECRLLVCAACRTARMGPWHGVFRVEHMIAFAELDDSLTDISY